MRVLVGEGKDTFHGIGEVNGHPSVFMLKKETQVFRDREISHVNLSRQVRVFCKGPGDGTPVGGEIPTGDG